MAIVYQRNRKAPLTAGHVTTKVTDQPKQGIRCHIIVEPSEASQTDRAVTFYMSYREAQVMVAELNRQLTEMGNDAI